MLSAIFKLVLFAIVLRMLYPLFKGMGALFGKTSTPGSGRAGKGGSKREYPDLTSYEIEDADFEEIRKK